MPSYAKMCVAILFKNQRSCEMQMVVPFHLNGVLEASKVATSRSLVGCRQTVAAARESSGELQSVAFTTGEAADLLLIVALKVVPAAVRARVHLASTESDFFAAAAQGVVHRLLRIQAIAALIDVHELDRFTDGNITAVGLFFTGDHSEERRFTGTLPRPMPDGSSGMMQFRLSMSRPRPG